MTLIARSGRSSGPAPSVPPLLEIRHLSKSYPGVTALEDVDFELVAGEVHCLVGENGAGKSTLVKLLGGAELATHGSISVGGSPVTMRTPVDALRAGIGVIYQDFRLVPYLSVAENISLGQLPQRARLPIVDWPALRERAERLLAMLGEELPVDCRVAELSPAQQQMVEIARVLSHEVRIVAMDEPSATLTDRELAPVSVIRRPTALGGVIYISHPVDEIDEIADRVTVLRDGRRWDLRASALDRSTLVRHMVGRELDDEGPRADRSPGEVMFRATGLRRAPAVHDVSFELRRGEVFCIAGLVGSGRTEVARLIVAADRKDGGRVELDGQEIAPRNPREAIELGIPAH
jgi:ABC-type sugar transport system ATPase subunit